MSTPPQDRARGERLLAAVERLLADPETLCALADACHARVRGREALPADARRARAAKEIVRTFSNRSALAGAVGGLLAGPASLPAGTLAELTYLLKTEAELCLALAHIHGFDIGDRRERQRALLLVAGEVAGEGGDAVPGGARAERSRLLERFTELAVSSFWRSAWRAVPVVGVAAGFTLNRALTARVGRHAMRDLEARRQERLRPAGVPRLAARRASARRAPGR